MDDFDKELDRLNEVFEYMLLNSEDAEYKPLSRKD